MAKVTGPLYSMGASGKIANAMVFFPWKGNNVVRQWLKPANPQTADQGDARMILGGAGRAAAQCGKNGSYVGQLNTLGLIPGGQTKQSYIVKKIIDLFATSKAVYEATYDEYAAHSAKSSFDTAASNLSLNTVSNSYQSSEKLFTGGLMVYMLAKLATTLNFTGSPYTTALASWDNSKITEMVGDFTS